MTKKIGIIGCGWLGMPLAESLLSDGYEVNGSSTSQEKLTLLKEKGINPFQISISESKIKGDIADFLDGLSVVVINIPPKLRGKGPKESYIEKNKLLHKAIKKSTVKNIIFASSTAVYGNAKGEVNEQTTPVPTTPSGIQLLQSENLFRNDKELNTTIIRFGGLIGPNRHPVTMLSGRENLNGGNAPVNLIHLDDCIGIIKKLIEHNRYNDVLNAVYPEHPSKIKYYTEQAIKRNLTPPKFTLTGKDLKLISSCSVFLIANYNFHTSIN
ncbi:NAD(P)H-binding protein [Maribacter ulvicola]|uniref:Nucleoside-diphosphate-sugar epimerase n=1 Tax=Maribacter ulvicola TaxID=228959 RepID=A0A1N6Q2U2_9FLAO|nr:NAD(P)H-binding protein [Maribacter ulvicola]SIQ11014.1 Nucleoside-diphosphate-sugar epimerase [Maribacter ulvicola]